MTVVKTEMEWSDPPASQQGGGRYNLTKVLEALRARPGEFARIRVYTRNTNAGVSAAGFRRRYPEFEFTSRRLDDGGGAVWARFKT